MMFFHVRPLLLVVDTQIAIFAQSFCVERSIFVVTLGSFLSPAFGVVAVLAHAVRIVPLSNVRAFGYHLPVSLGPFPFRMVSSAFRLLTSGRTFRVAILLARVHVEGVIRGMAAFTVGNGVVFMDIVLVGIMVDMVFMGVMDMVGVVTD